MSELTVNVLYSCRQCGLRKVSVSVPARSSDAEDVVVWVEATGRLLGQDHMRRSPHCHITELSDVMIPITGADHIGGVQKQ